MSVSVRVRNLFVFDRVLTPRERLVSIGWWDGGLRVLSVGRFTWYAGASEGRRPTWDQAAPGSVAEPIIDAVAAAFTSLGAPVSTGRFGADMQVTFTNDGPVTISLEI